MKKILFTLAIAIFSLNIVNAQTIQNGDFELWSYGKAVGWAADMHGYVSSIFPVAVNFGEQTTDAHSGNYAMKLHSNNFSVPSTQYEFNIPGILQLGESGSFNVSISDLMDLYNAFTDSTGSSQIDLSNLESLATLAQMLSKGVPCNTTPAALGMWIKYIPDGEDYMAIIAATKRNGQFVDYSYNLFGAKEEYTQVGVNFAHAGAECDSIMLIVFSSTRANKNSELFVDDVEILDAPLNVTDFQKQNIQVYPNPASGYVYVNTSNTDVCKWNLTDLSGKLINRGSIVETTKIDVSMLKSGIYLLKVEGKNFNDTRKILIY